MSLLKLSQRDNKPNKMCLNVKDTNGLISTS